MRVSILAAPVLLLALAGCNTPDANTVAMSCPATAVLYQASTITRLRPNWKNASDVILSANMTQPQLVCNYHAGDNTVDVDLRFPLEVQRGAAAAGGTQRLTYFVAVVDGAGNMLSKRIFDRDVDLNAAPTQKLMEEVDDTEITLATDKKPYDYEILTGFQLTPDELAFNRARADFRR